MPLKASPAPAGQLVSPVTGEFLGVIADVAACEVDAHAARLAEAFQPATRAALARARLERCDQLDAVAAALLRRGDEIVADFVLEHGKPLRDAREEIEGTAEQLRLVASFARATGAAVPPVWDARKRVTVAREPIGVIGVITPWNYPCYIPVEYLAPVLVMGNAVLWKPAESTPRTSAHLLAAFREGGFDEDRLVMLEGGPAVGRAVVGCQALAALGFTGSSRTGHQIGASFSGRPLISELGGNGPTLVFADAELSRAAAAIAMAAFVNAGQSCAASERVLVERPVAAELVERLVAEAGAYRLGDPREPGTTLGPLHLARTADAVAAHVEDAVARGALVVCGGRPDDQRPTDRYWPATVLTDVSPDSQLFLEETFGPVAPVTAFESEGEALELAERGGWGLCASIFTADIARAHRIADGLPHGFVTVNDHSDYWEPQLPVGGGRGTRSGAGRLGVEEVLRFASTTKVLAVDAS